MSWHCSQEEGGDFSLVSYLAGLRCARSKSEAMHGIPFCKDKETGPWSNSRCGMMSAPSMAGPGEEQLTLLPEDSLVQTLAAQGKAQELPASVAAFGKNISESLAKLDLVLSMPKTAHSFESVDSAPSSKTLPAWGMSVDGVCWELGTSVKYIEGIECGLLPNLLPTPSGVNGGRNHIAGRLDEWGGSSNPFRKTEIGNVHSPRFEEWMMGWPETWAALTGFEMDKYQSWLQMHGLSYQAACNA